MTQVDLIPGDIFRLTNSKSYDFTWQPHMLGRFYLALSTLPPTDLDRPGTTNVQCFSLRHQRVIVLCVYADEVVREMRV